MRDYLVLGIIFGSLPFVIARPYIGILVWSWISYMNPHRMTWVAQNYPVAAIVAVALFLGLPFSKEPKRIPWNSVTIVWLIFVFWMCITTLFALDPDAGNHWEKVMKIQLLSFLTLALMYTRQRLDWLIIVIVVSIGFFAVKGGIFTILTGGNYTIWGPPGSFIGGNNEIGLAILMVLPFMNYLRQVANRVWIRRLLVLVMVLSALTVLATYSRGALVAGAAITVFLIWKTPKRNIFILSALLIIPLLLNFMPERWYERMGTISHFEQDKSALGRINAWHFAYNLAKDRPLVGGGFQTFDPALFERYAPNPLDFHDAHSIYFEILGEHGFVGLFLFLLLGGLTWRMAGSVIRRTRKIPELAWAKNLAAMSQVSLVAYAVGGAFLGLAYFDLYYHIIGIVILTHTIADKQLAERTATDENAAASGSSFVATASVSQVEGPPSQLERPSRSIGSVAPPVANTQDRH